MDNAALTKNPNNKAAVIVSTLRIIAACGCITLFTPWPQGVAAAAAEDAGLHHVVFDRYGQSTHGLDFLTRVFSPIAGEAMRRKLTVLKKMVAAQPLNLSKETFALYIPYTPPPPRGYALLVFVSPEDDANLPYGWSSVLDAHHVIYVSAARSGNDQDVLTRREPLALLAVENVTAKYPVDPDLIFIGGFSGGSKVAERLGLAFPDIFHGVLLSSGAEPVGAVPDLLPARRLVSQLQETTRIAFIIGERDDINVSEGDRSAQSMIDHCVYNLDTIVMPSAIHEVATPQSLSKALDFLARPAAAYPARLATCREDLDRMVTKKLDAIDAAIMRHPKVKAEPSVAYS